jgi:hypothetical protein
MVFYDIVYWSMKEIWYYPEAHEGVTGGHYVGKETTQNIFHAVLWWPTLHKDDKELCQSCDVC